MIDAWTFEQLNVSAESDPLKFDARQCADEYAWRLDCAVRAENLGFTGVFFSEHHFQGLRVCPAPGQFAAAVAARTSTLRIGFLGLVLPLWQPWRVVEEIGTLDQISNGRAELGVARGTGPAEAEAVGIPAEETGPRYEEALDILDRALAEPSFSHHGRFWSFDQLTVVPRPVQNPPPRPWTAARSTHSAASAGHRGHRLCSAFLPTEQITEIFDAYRAAADRRGRRPRPRDLALRRTVFVAASSAAAADRSESARRLLPDLPASDIVAGTPSEVAEQLIHQARETGAANVIGFFAGDWLDRPAVEESYRLFGEQVIPALRRC
ncbi:LLM class flavin-dependent oxidoreductase [Streptomyces caeruleatus]|uniref:Luciferase n=1 Tax=Streptomyces caeruleatus TaxID=661399 RepID=A0A101U8E6_9ACTN|nr:LLM class flavin-dependent oxidoreductase [Streptomyces caeruleatus]KUO06130.1 luciferase [Streptomyces caeruleatus]